MNSSKHEQNTSPGYGQAQINQQALSQIDFNAKDITARAILNEHNRKQKASVPILLFVIGGLFFGLAKLGAFVFSIDVYLATAAIFVSAISLRFITGAPIFSLLTHVLKRITPLGVFHKKNAASIAAVRKQLSIAMNTIRLSDYAGLAAVEPNTKEKFELVMEARHEEYGFRAFIESPTLMFVLLGLLIELQELEKSGF